MSGPVSRRALVGGGLGSLSLLAAAAGPLAATDPAGATVDPATRGAIAALLARVAEHWRALDTPGLEALWDTSRAPLYVAEESTEIHTSFESLRRYWANAREATLRMGLELGPAELVPLAPDLITAMFPLHWECVLKGESAPIGGDNRAFAVLRRVAGEWRFTQYIEAPLAPLVYLHRLYEQSVTPGFGR